MAKETLHLTPLESWVSRLVFVLHVSGAILFYILGIDGLAVLYGFLAFLLVGILGGEIGWHRMVVHNSFSSTPTKEFFLQILANLFSVFLVKPMGLQHLKTFHTDLLLSNPSQTQNQSLLKLLSRRKNTLPGIACFLIYFGLVWLRQFNILFAIHFGCLLALFLESSKLLKTGYKNFSDKPGFNLRFLNRLTSYMGLTNNHITYPASPFNNFLPSEKDTVGWFILRFLKEAPATKTPPFKKIPNLNFLSDILENALEEHSKKWELYSNGNHKDIYLAKDFPPLSKHFKKVFWNDCGYAITIADHLVPFHEDLGLDATGAFLNRDDGRRCAILIPIQGDFKNVAIEFLDSSGHQSGSVYLDTATLIVTTDQFFHKVDNRQHPDRLFFYINFYGEKDFQSVLSWLEDEGYTQSK